MTAKLRRTGVAALAALGVTAALWLGVWFCPTAVVLHVPCPGCGMTRAAFALLRGDLGAALRFHPLCFVVVPLAAVFVLANAVSYVRYGSVYAGKRIAGRWVEYAAYVLLFALVALWIARFFGAFGGPAPV